MATKSRATLTPLNRPVLPAGVYTNTGGYRRFAHVREYLVTVDGVAVGEVHSAKHSGSYGTTYWLTVREVTSPHPGRVVLEHTTRAAGVAALVAAYDAGSVAGVAV